MRTRRRGNRPRRTGSPSLHACCRRPRSRAPVSRSPPRRCPFARPCERAAAALPRLSFPLGPVRPTRSSCAAHARTIGLWCIGAAPKARVACCTAFGRRQRRRGCVQPPGPATRAPGIGAASFCAWRVPSGPAGRSAQPAGSPALPARRPSPAAVPTPSLSISCARCALTVRRLMPSRSAICWLRWPATTRSKTSRSRAVRRAQPGVALRLQLPRGACLGVGVQRRADGAEQPFARDRLFQHIGRAGLDRAHGGRHVGVGGQEDDRQRDAALAQRRLQIEPGGAGQPHVEQQAAGAIGQRVQQERAGRSVAHRLEAGGTQQVEQAVAQRLVVVDDMHEGVAAHRHAAAVVAPASSGSSKLKMVPASGLLAASMRPPWASTIVRTMARPSPMPCGLVL